MLQNALTFTVNVAWPLGNPFLVVSLLTPLYLHVSIPSTGVSEVSLRTQAFAALRFPYAQTGLCHKVINWHLTERVPSSSKQL
jgi:hypothetical protein